MPMGPNLRLCAFLGGWDRKKREEAFSQTAKISCCGNRVLADESPPLMALLSKGVDTPAFLTHAEKNGSNACATCTAVLSRSTTHL